MTKYFRSAALLCLILIAALSFLCQVNALAASAAEIDRNVNASLKTLFTGSPSAKALAEKSAGNTVKALLLRTAK
jgi:hypothetical protein